MSEFLLQITGAKSEVPKMLESTKDVEYLNDMQTYTQLVDKVHLIAPIGE